MLLGNVHSGSAAWSQLSPPPYDPPDTATCCGSRSGNAAAVSAARYWLSRISTSLFFTRIVPLGRQFEPAALPVPAVGGRHLGSPPAGVSGWSGRSVPWSVKPRAV